MPWLDEFRDRLAGFRAMNPPQSGEIPISIKVRVDSGCYSRSCCPHAFRLIDEELQQRQKYTGRFIFEEHESGPEIIVYLAVTTAGLALAKSTVDLVTAIIKARSEGCKHGDRHDDPVTLIVRKLEDKDRLAEERLLTFHKDDQVTRRIVDDALMKGCKAITRKGTKKGTGSSSMRAAARRGKRG